MPSPYHKSGRCQWEYGEADKSEITEYGLQRKQSRQLPGLRPPFSLPLSADPTIIPVPGPPFQPLPFLPIQQQPDPSAADEEVINQEQ